MLTRRAGLPAPSGTRLLLCLAGIALIPTAGAEVPYKAAIEGEGDKEVVRALQAVSRTFTLANRPPASPAQLGVRVEQDVERMQAELRSRGFYNATITSDIDIEETPAHVLFTVDRGPVYPIHAVHLVLESSDEALPPPDIETRLEPGERGAAATILREEKRLVRLTQRKGYPFARMRDRQVVVDHAERHITVNWSLSTGPVLQFGPITVEGLNRVRETVVLRQVPWMRSDLYDIRQVEKLESLLLGSGLFTSISVIMEEEGIEGGEVPVRIRVVERKHRTIRVGIEYQSDTGVGGLVSWEHRNLFNGGERLELKAGASDVEYGGEVLFERPGFLRADQSLLLNVKTLGEDTDAYESDSIEAAAFLRRTIRPSLKVSGGVAYKYDDATQLGLSSLYSLYSVPLALDWNRSDDLLNPSRGWRVFVEAAPVVDAKQSDTSWLTSFVELRHYLRLPFSRRLVLAGRLAVGSIAGAEPGEVPPDERFFAGGGGSIRGYEYQSVGPLAEDGTPLGGTALLETSLEARVNISESWGLVGFVDGGTVYNDEIPNSDETVRWGAGLGVRYFTGIGPVRLDIAAPLNRRPDIDDRVQFYISLGQAF